VLITAPLNQVLAPLFAEQSPAARQSDAWACFAILSGVCMSIVIMLIALAGVWVPLLVPGFALAGKTLAIALTQIQLLSLIFQVPFCVLWSLQCAKGRLVVAEATQVISSFVSLVAAAFLLPRFGVRAAAFAVVLKTALDVLLLIRILGPMRHMTLRSSLMTKVWRRARYLLAGAVYFSSESFVNTWLTSFVGAGGLSAFSLGQQLYNVLGQVVHKAIAAPMMPRLASAASEGRWGDVRRIYQQRTGWAAGMAVVAFAGLVLIGKPLLGLLVGRSGITASNVDLIWLTLVALGGMCFGALMGQVTVSALHALGDTKTPTQFGFLTYTIYIPLKIAAFTVLGLTGLALASSIFFLVNLAGQYVLLSRAVTKGLRQDMGQAFTATSKSISIRHG